MIINSLCNSCLQPYQIIIETSDVVLVRQVVVENGKLAPCPRLCGGFINMQGDATIEEMVQDPRLKKPMSITGKELYKAVNGAGLPDEIPQSRETIEALLKANKVVGTKLEEIDGRFYIHEVALENGLTLHLAAGLRGAHVLKVTRGN